MLLQKIDNLLSKMGMMAITWVPLLHSSVVYFFGIGRMRSAMLVDCKLRSPPVHWYHNENNLPMKSVVIKYGP